MADPEETWEDNTTWELAVSEESLPEPDEDDGDPRWWDHLPSEKEAQPLWEREVGPQPCEGCGEPQRPGAVLVCPQCLDGEESERRWERLRGPVEPDFYRHCDLDPVAYTSDQACRLCYQWLRRNGTKYSAERLQIELEAQVERRKSLRSRRQVELRGST
jgi:hypothetical protein